MNEKKFFFTLKKFSSLYLSYAQTSQCSIFREKEMGLRSSRTVDSENDQEEFVDGVIKFMNIFFLILEFIFWYCMHFFFRFLQNVFLMKTKCVWMVVVFLVNHEQSAEKK